MALGSGRCHYHPERAGLGICVECRHVICTECTTQFEGINRCASCLEARRAKLRRPTERSDWRPATLALAASALGLLYAGIYGLAALFRP